MSLAATATTRVLNVNLRIEDGPISATEYTGRRFRVTDVKIEYRQVGPAEWRWSHVEWSGPVPKKDGSDGVNRADAHTSNKDKIPDWLAPLVATHTPGGAL